MKIYSVEETYTVVVKRFIIARNEFEAESMFEDMDGVEISVDSGTVIATTFNEMDAYTIEEVSDLKELQE